MPAAQHETGQTAYKPTSLEFINLPNPIEPYAGTQRHPLNGTPRLEKARLETSTDHRVNLFLNDGNDRPTKRQKTIDNPHLDLPKLPPVRSGPKRQRIPPTLSGLHQPPPDAGLLPSISVEKPQSPSPHPAVARSSKAPTQSSRAGTTSSRDVIAQQEQPPPALSKLRQPPPDPGILPPIHTEKPTSPPPAVGKKSRPAQPTQPSDEPRASTAGTQDQPQKAKAFERKRGRNKWSDEETEDLLKGVSRFGIGSWTKILNCADYSFTRRTALDLKDRFRVCCPEQYKRPTKNSALEEATENNDPVPKEPEAEKTIASRPSNSQATSDKLRELGIEKPFARSGRRLRHGYSPAEDEALLKGFKKYGAQWAQIRQDKELDLSSRRPTDLRDRLRSKFPDEYAKAGLASKKDKPSGVPNRMAEETYATATSFGVEALPDPDDSTKSKTSKAIAVISAEGSAPIQSILGEEHSVKAKSTASRQRALPSLFHLDSLDDVFLSAPLGEDEHEGDSEPITLDRGILDWASGDNNKTLPTDVSKSSGIDPVMTLKLPKPHASLQTPVPVTQSAVTAHNLTSLPSLSTILPDNSNPDQLELPSLMTWIGQMDDDGKNTSSAFPWIAELFGNDQSLK